MHNPDSNYIANCYCRYGLQRLFSMWEAYYPVKLTPRTLYSLSVHAMLFNCHRVQYTRQVQLCSVLDRGCYTDPFCLLSQQSKLYNCHYTIISLLLMLLIFRSLLFSMILLYIIKSILSISEILTFCKFAAIVCRFCCLSLFCFVVYIIPYKSGVVNTF